jgi:hypothetical protein
MIFSIGEKEGKICVTGRCAPREETGVLVGSWACKFGVATTVHKHISSAARWFDPIRPFLLGTLLSINIQSGESLKFPLSSRLYRIIKGDFGWARAVPTMATRYRTVREYSVPELPALARNVRRIGG